MNNDKSKWLTEVEKATKQKTKSFVCNDKLGEKVTLEWGMINSKASGLPKVFKDVSDLIVDAYIPVELEFLREYSQDISEDAFYKKIAHLFEQGPAKADWKEVEEEVAGALEEIGEMDVSKILGDNDVLFYVIARGEDGVPVGVIHFLVKSDYDAGSVKSPLIAIAPNSQGRGLDKILMGSILKLIPETKRIFLCTRVTNENAINAYKKWGFVIDENSEPEAWINKKHWINLEYDVDNANVLQKQIVTQAFSSSR